MYKKSETGSFSRCVKSFNMSNGFNLTQADASVTLNSVRIVVTLQLCGCDWTPCRGNGTCCPVEVRLDNRAQVNRKYVTGSKNS